MLKSICISLFCLVLINAANAQVKKPKSNTTKAIKPPKLTTWLGEYKDTVKLSVAETERVIALPLRITDKNNTVYSISTFQFIYRKKNTFEDDETGKISTSTTSSARLFKTTPLPEMWLSTIKEQLHAGEDLYFFDIIAKDPQGRVMYAPGLNIIVQ